MNTSTVEAADAIAAAAAWTTAAFVLADTLDWLDRLLDHLAETRLMGALDRWIGPAWVLVHRAAGARRADQWGDCPQGP